MSVFELDISSEKIEDGLRILAVGRVSMSNANLLQYEVDKAIEDGHKKILVNMSRVEYLSSTGIRVILKAYKDAVKNGQKLAIERPSESVRNVLGIAALGELMEA